MAIWLGEILVSIAFIVLSVILFILSNGFAGGATNNPIDIGPAAFPRLVLVLIIVFSIIQIIISLRSRKQIIDGKQEGNKVVINNKLALLGTCILLVAYGLLMPIVGFYIATPALIVLVLLLMGNRKWLQLVLVPTGFVVFVYLVFSMLLKVSLP